MLYHCDELNVNILSVFRCTNKKGKYHVSGRAYHALAFRVGGSARFTFSSGSCITSMPLNVLYMPAELEYAVEYTDGETIVVHFFADEYKGECENYVILSEKVYILFERLLKNWQDKSNPMKIKAMLYEILSTLREEELKSDLQENGVQSVMRYLEDNFADPETSIEKACKACSVSASNLRVKFKKQFGKTPNEFLMGLRIEHALRLLSLKEFSIEEIAEKSGFSDSKYFARVIKKTFGVSPSQFVKTRFV